MKHADECTIDGPSQTVKPEFRLSFGHVLFSSISGEQLIKRVAKACSLQKIEKCAGYNASMLPSTGNDFHRQFGGDGFSILIIVELQRDVALFGPHEWFTNNTKWIKLNSLLRNTMAIVIRTTRSSTNARCFQSGRLAGFVGLEPDSIDRPVIPSYDVTIGERAIRIPGGEAVLEGSPSDLLVKKDIVFDVSDDRLIFRKRFGNESISEEKIQWYRGESNKFGLLSRFFR